MASYETITIDPGEHRNISIGSGQTFANKLIDITATGADVQLTTSGSGWEIRNVGVRGQFTRGQTGDLGHPDHEGGFNEVLNVNGSGTVDTFYAGDGVAYGTDIAGTIVGPYDVGPGNTITFRRSNVQGMPNNGMYVAGYAGEPQGGQGGQIVIEDSYLVDNNVAQVRCSGNLTVRNCTIGNTGNTTALWETVGGARNVVNARGVRADYGTQYNPVEVIDCDIDTSAETGVAVAVVQDAEPGQVIVRNSQVRGGITDGVVTENVGSNPNMSPPAGCPTSAEAAASGDGGGGGNGGQTYAHRLRITSGPTIGRVRYELETTGEISPTSLSELDNNDSLTQLPNGHWNASGEMGSGYADEWDFNGGVVRFSLDRAPEAYTLTLDGSQATVEDVRAIEETSDDGDDGDDGGNGDEKTAGLGALALALAAGYLYRKARSV